MAFPSTPPNDVGTAFPSNYEMNGCGTICMELLLMVLQKYKGSLLRRFFEGTIGKASIWN
jgi:hypothetical protein